MWRNLRFFLFALLGCFFLVVVGRSQAQTPTELPECPITSFTGDVMSLEARYLVECGHCIQQAQATATSTRNFATQPPTATVTRTPSATGTLIPTFTPTATPNIPAEFYSVYAGGEDSFLAYGFNAYSVAGGNALPLSPRHKTAFYLPAYSGFRLVGFSWYIDDSEIDRPEDVSFWALCMFSCSPTAGSAWSGAADQDEIISIGCADIEIYTGSYDELCNYITSGEVSEGAAWAHHTYAALTGGGGAGYIGYWVDPTASGGSPTLAPSLYPNLRLEVQGYYVRDIDSPLPDGIVNTATPTLTPSQTFTALPTSTNQPTITPSPTPTGWTHTFDFQISNQGWTPFDLGADYVPGQGWSYVDAQVSVTYYREIAVYFAVAASGSTITSVSANYSVSPGTFVTSNDTHMVGVAGNVVTVDVNDSRPNPFVWSGSGSTPTNILTRLYLDVMLTNGRTGSGYLRSVTVTGTGTNPFVTYPTWTPTFTSTATYTPTASATNTPTRTNTPLSWTATLTPSSTIDPEAGYCSDWRYLHSPTPTVVSTSTRTPTPSLTPTTNWNGSATAVHGTATHSAPDTATALVTQFTGYGTSTAIADNGTIAAATATITTATAAAQSTATWIATNPAQNAPIATVIAFGTQINQTQIAFGTPSNTGGSGEYEYGDGAMRGEGDGIDFGTDFGLSFSLTRRQGACYTLIPNINLDQFIHLHIEKVEACVEWVVFPRIDLFGVVFPVELALLPLVAQILRWIYSL